MGTLYLVTFLIFISLAWAQNPNPAMSPMSGKNLENDKTLLRDGSEKKHIKKIKKDAKPDPTNEKPKENLPTDVE
jgi:hypothetical protein